MTGFEPGSSGKGTDGSTSYQMCHYHLSPTLYYIVCLLFWVAKLFDQCAPQWGQTIFSLFFLKKGTR